MVNIIKNILLKKQVKAAIEHNDVKLLYNMEHAKYMVTHVAYRIECDKMAIFASQYWDNSQGTLYSSDITFKDGRSITPNETLAKKIFWRLQDKYAQQKKR